MAVADCEDCLALTTFRGRQARGDHDDPSWAQLTQPLIG